MIRPTDGFSIQKRVRGRLRVGSDEPFPFGSENHVLFIASSRLSALRAIDRVADKRTGEERLGVPETDGRTERLAALKASDEAGWHGIPPGGTLPH
jgi:hypothetical protein